MTGRIIAASIALFSLAARADEAADARKHFQAGQLHYTLGEFEEAATEFKEAYRLKHEPAILFNIAQAMRKSFQWERANFYFGQYLKNKPDAPNRSEVEGLMLQMKEKMDESAPQRTPQEAPQAQAVPKTPPAVEAKPPPAVAKGAPPAVAKAAPPAVAKAAPPAVAKAAPPAAPPAPQGPLVAKAAPAGVPASKTAAAVEAPRAGARASPSPAPKAALATAAPGGSPSGARVAGYVGLGLGLGAEALAFAFHSSAQSKADQFNQKYDARTLTPADGQLKTDAESKGKLSTAAAIGGAVLLATGAVLVFAF